MATLSPPRYRLALSTGAVLCICSAVSHVAAQEARESEAFVQQQQLVQRATWDQIDEELTPAEKADFDFGGSYSFHLFIYDDGIESSRTFRRHDLRVWSRLSLDQGAHEFYARVRGGFLDFNSGDGFVRDDDWEGPSLERGFYRFDLRRAMRAWGRDDLNFDLRMKVGRDLVQFGTGLALWQVLDHVAVQYIQHNVELTGLAGRTVGSQEDLDRSRPLDRTRRTFYGAQARYLGVERHRPFAYVLWQRDHNSETWPTPLQEFDYDSFYVGIGSRGELAKNLGYSTEWIHESGHSYGNRRFLSRDHIRAWAFDMQLVYLFEHETRPKASIEYLFASGDSNRLASPTNAIGGNRFDGTDSGFNAFGYRDTGLGFAPVMSNLHMWRLGASFYPFAGDRWLDKLEMGTNWFLYWKNHRDGAVSDATANVRSGYLGWEMDYYANWEITNDLAWTVRGGLFFPGEAFSDTSVRPFILTGVTWSF
jgi:hypothetical protein